jgi:hypothetical protein
VTATYANTLYEYAVIYDPPLDIDGDPVDAQPAVLLVPPTHVIAGDEAAARMHAARAIPDMVPASVDVGEDQANVDLDRCRVLVRPFC